jgi:hypothetical protein
MLTDNSEGQPTTADKLLQMGFQKYGMEDFAISVQHGQQEVYRSTAPVQSQKASMSCSESRASGCRSL